MIYKNKNDFLKDSFTWDLRKKHGFNLIELEKNQLKNLLPGISNEYQFAIKIYNMFLKKPFRYECIMANILEDYSKLYTLFLIINLLY